LSNKWSFSEEKNSKKRDCTLRQTSRSHATSRSSHKVKKCGILISKEAAKMSILLSQFALKPLAPNSNQISRESVVFPNLLVLCSVVQELFLVFGNVLTGNRLLL
jgi:hypothetical protein